jgi:ribosomal protein S18 acetylase RimI-like enzyme
MSFVECRLCGMSYVPEIPDNVRDHQEYHDKVVNGLPAHPSESGRVIWSQDDMRIIIVDGLSPLEQRHLAEEVAILARKDTPYGAEVLFGECELDTHVFLLHRQNRIIGLLIVEKRDHVWQTSWADLDAGKEPKELLTHPPMWSICFIWIIQHHRGSHLGQTMINEAVAYLGGNFKTIGWYSPFTDSGKALVCRCCPEIFYIAK